MRKLKRLLLSLSLSLAFVVGGEILNFISFLYLRLFGCRILGYDALMMGRDLILGSTSFTFRLRSGIYSQAWTSFWAKNVQVSELVHYI